MSEYKFKITNCPQQELTYTNYVFCSIDDYHQIIQFYIKNKIDYSKVFVDIYNVIYIIEKHPNIQNGFLGCNQLQRSSCKLSINQEIIVNLYFQNDKNFQIDTIICNIDFFKKDQITADPIDVLLLEEYIRKNYNNQIFTVKQQFIIDYNGICLKVIINDISNIKFNKTSDIINEIVKSNRGQLNKISNCIFNKNTISVLNLINNKTNTTSTKIFRPDFSFETLGIGGLNNEISDIFRRAFASRVFPFHIMNELGIQHVKGMILYGPPGCGKTLIARQIGKLLCQKEPKLVNGPEILNKYVGQSEENIRNLFKDAENDYKTFGDNSDLHIIIFDEIDALCRQRGMKNDSTGVGDKIVNQLLSKIDGVDSLNNILVIGMTNRIDLIDEALLRPGRMEIKIEISIPNKEGRIQILKIHLNKIIKNKYLDNNVDIEELAEITENFSGAELEAICKSATSFALERNIDPNDIKNSVNINNIKICRNDFINALNDVNPNFGTSDDIKTYLKTMNEHGIYKYNTTISHLTKTEILFTQFKKSKILNHETVLIEGYPGTGKTSLAVLIAEQSKFPFIKIISAETLVELSEINKVSYISKIFNDAYKSYLSLIILDDIEKIIEYINIGPRFSNVVLQTLLIFLKRIPPKNNKIFIIGTTSSPSTLELLETHNLFNITLQTPLLDFNDIKTILNLTNLVEKKK